MAGQDSAVSVADNDNVSLHHHYKCAYQFSIKGKAIFLSD